MMKKDHLSIVIDFCVLEEDIVMKTVSPFWSFLQMPGKEGLLSNIEMFCIDSFKTKRPV